MNSEIFRALDELETEKRIDKAYMMGKITQALATAYKKDSGEADANVVVDVDYEKQSFEVYIQKTVVEEVENDRAQISLEQAKEISAKYEMGDVVNIPVSTAKFGRIAAQNAKQVIIQGIREAERNMMIKELSEKEHELLTGVVYKVDSRTGSIIFEIVGKNDKSDAILTPSEQIRGEIFNVGDHVKLYVLEVKPSMSGNAPHVMVSRTHPNLIKRLFELEVPEITDGTVMIHSVAREAGSRSKIAVSSDNPNVGAIGACVGPKGARVASVVDELCGEKIDIINYSEDMCEFVAAALAPAEVISVDMLDGGKSCRVIVPDDQLSLAIGKEGQNGRLAAKLTGFKSDIKSETRAKDAAGLMLGDC